MYTLNDYINYYGNSSISDVKWNKQDTLICALLSYLVFTNVRKEYSLSDYEEFLNDYEEAILKDYTARNVYDILKKIKDVKRYKDLRIVNSEFLLNNDTQFGALTLKNEDLTIVSFRGSDTSFIAWMENFRIGYRYPTYTQDLAIRYLNKVKASKIIVTGHSKGGNLALVSSMESSKSLFNKIIEIDNFDGPGLRWEEYTSSKYDMIIPKLYNYIPSNSYIGSMLYNDNYYVVKTNTKGISVHYPFNWELFGEFFVQGEYTSLSKKVNNVTTKQFDSLNAEAYMNTLEKIFKMLPRDKSGSVKVSLREFKDIISNLNDIDKETKSYLLTIINTFLIGFIN